MSSVTAVSLGWGDDWQVGRIRKEAVDEALRALRSRALEKLPPGTTIGRDIKVTHVLVPSDSKR